MRIGLLPVDHDRPVARIAATLLASTRPVPMANALDLGVDGDAGVGSDEAGLDIAAIQAKPEVAGLDTAKVVAVSSHTDGSFRAA